VNNKVFIVISLVIAVIIVGGIYLITKPKNTVIRTTTAIKPVPINQVEPSSPEAVESIPPAPITQFEPTLPAAAIEESTPEPALPTLNNSDAHISQTLSEHTAFSTMASWLTKDEIIRKSVVAIDNLAKGNVVAKYRPVNFKNKSFVVEQRGNKFYLDRRNYNRYNQWIDIITSTEIEAWGSLINRYQPWLDQAFSELGYKDKTFIGQLDLALQQIMQAPLITTDIELIRPSVLYKYADKEIEQLPAIQKLMIRMGPENSNKLKHWASALRDAIKQQ